MKVCRACHKRKKNKDFVINRRNSDKLDAYCKLCKREKTAAFRRTEAGRRYTAESNRTRDNVSINRRYYLRHKEKELDRCYKKRHGIGTATKNALLQKQSGKCSICGICGEGVTWNVDHSHSTGRIRGVLCWSCNVALGFVKEDTRILKNCIEYLRFHTGAQADISDLNLSLPAGGLLGKEIFV